jgi:hypothetical protein
VFVDGQPYASAQELAELSRLSPDYRIICRASREPAVSRQCASLVRGISPSRRSPAFAPRENRVAGQSEFCRFGLFGLSRLLAKCSYWDARSLN